MRFRRSTSPSNLPVSAERPLPAKNGGERGASARRRADDPEVVIFRRLPDDPVRRPWYFLSLRWKVMLPLVIVVLAVSGGGTYLVLNTLAREARQTQVEDLLRANRALSGRMTTLGADEAREAARLAYTEGVGPALVAQDAETLQIVLEPLAAASTLDLLLVADSAGQEVLGLQRVEQAPGGLDYAVATGTDLGSLLATSGDGALLVRTRSGPALLAVAPVPGPDGAPVGWLAAGWGIPQVLHDLQAGEPLELALFGAEAEFLRTTLVFDEATLRELALTPEAYRQALTSPGALPVTRQHIDGQAYYSALMPFVINGAPLGVLASYAPDETLFATQASRQNLSLIAAGLVALVMLVTFAGVGRYVRRLERVTRTADALASGDVAARTGLGACDEIGELGATLDRMANRYQRRADALQSALREQRAESARLFAVLEAIPDGVVVQDMQGRVLLVNEAARRLLGGQRGFRANRLYELSAVVTEAVGPALAPGLYALGDPTRIALDQRMLQAQAAGITIGGGGEVNGASERVPQRIGTVIVLRDITAEVEREQARERLLDQLAAEVVAPSPQQYNSLTALAQEVTRNTRALQRVISDLRDLSTFEARDLQAGQQPLILNDLLWNIASEWQPLADVAKIRLQTRFGPPELYVLGDDRRLRWAVGNLVDNALKYSAGGAVVTLTARTANGKGEAEQAEAGLAEIVIEDMGYGIAPEDLANAFTRFYRGAPRDEKGHLVRKPGTGQGLYIARRVIEAHGGQITLTSRLGAGTTAIVSLPLTASQALNIPEPAATEDATRPHDLDDEPPPALSRGQGYDTMPVEARTPAERRRRSR